MDGFEDATTVLISCCCGDRADCFEGFPHDGYFPANKICGGTYNTWCQTANVDSVDKATPVIRDLITTINDIDDTIIPDIEDYYGGDEGINEYWSGYIAITKDNKLVAFICRDDDMMLDDDGPTVLFDFNDWKCS